MRATPEYGQVVLYDPIIDLMVSVVLAKVLLVLDAFLSVRSERNGEP